MPPPPHTLEPASSDEVHSPGAKAQQPASPSGKGLFSPDERAAIKSSWDAVVAAPSPEEAKAKQSALGQAFIEQLLKEHPALAALFPFARGEHAGKPDVARMAVHGAKVLGVVDVVAGLISRAEDDTLVKAVDDLVKRHVKYQVQLEHYDQVLGVFAAFLSGALASMGKWNEHEASGWTKVVGAIKGVAVKVYAPTA